MRFETLHIYGNFRIRDRITGHVSTWFTSERSADSVVEMLNKHFRNGATEALENSLKPYYFKEREGQYNVSV